jgi:hypothetical protein
MIGFGKLYGALFARDWARRISDETRGDYGDDFRAAGGPAFVLD